MYHFATNEPQSYVLGGDSTLYIVTLVSGYCRFPPVIYHPGSALNRALYDTLLPLCWVVSQLNPPSK